MSHLYAVASRGAIFRVMPRHFVAAHEHAKSASWHATFGDQADPSHRMRVQALYRRLKLANPLPATALVAALVAAPTAASVAAPKAAVQGETAGQAEEAAPAQGGGELATATMATRGLKRCAIEAGCGAERHDKSMRRNGPPPASLPCVG